MIELKDLESPMPTVNMPQQKTTTEEEAKAGGRDAKSAYSLGAHCARLPTHQEAGSCEGLGRLRRRKRAARQAWERVASARGRRQVSQERVERERKGEEGGTDCAQYPLEPTRLHQGGGRASATFLASQARSHSDVRVLVPDQAGISSHAEKLRIANDLCDPEEASR